MLRCSGFQRLGILAKEDRKTKTTPKLPHASEWLRLARRQARSFSAPSMIRLRMSTLFARSSTTIRTMWRGFLGCSSMKRRAPR